SGTVVARRAALGAGPLLDRVGPRSRDAAPGPPWGADQGSRPLRGWARRLRRRVRGVASARGFGPRAPRLLRGRARGGTVRAPGSRRQAPRPAFGRSRGFGERARGGRPGPALRRGPSVAGVPRTPGAGAGRVRGARRRRGRRVPRARGADA